MDTSSKHILVDYGRRTYAFGLQWFFGEEDEPTRKQAISFIRRSGNTFDLFGERKGEYPQYTVASSIDGFKPGIIAAASIVAERVDGKGWLYVAEIENAYWITYGRDNRIMAEGDRIYTSEIEARAAFEALEPSRWPYLAIPKRWKDEMYADRDIGLTDLSVEISDVKELFQHPVKELVRLEALSATATIVKGGLLAVLLSGAAFLGWSFLAPGPTGPTPEEQAAEAQRLAQLAQQEQERIFAELDASRPWEEVPPAPAFIDGCMAALRAMPLAPARYVYESAECAAGTITGSYQRGTSYPSWLREWSAQHPEFEVDINIETAAAFISRTWEAPGPRGPETLATYVTLTRFLNESALLIPGQMTYTQPVVWTYEEYPEYVPLYGVSDLTITTSEPEQWRLALERLPGITITTVRRQADDASYIMEGQIYVSNR